MRLSIVGSRLLNTTTPIATNAGIIIIPAIVVMNVSLVFFLFSTVDACVFKKCIGFF
jgi:hypothetical protein